jgi:hypothetical protein
VRTTIDLSARVLTAAKRIAAERRTTLSSIVNEALGEYLQAIRRHGSDKPFELIVRGRAGGRFPAPTEIASAMDEEDRAALCIPGMSRRVDS